MAKHDDILDEANNGVASPVTPDTATAQISALVSDVTQLASAELSYYKTRFAYSQTVLKRAGFFALLAIATFFAAIAALIFGLLLVVAFYAGPIIAVVSVTFGFLAIAVLAGLMARRTAQNLSFADVKAPIDD
jgi:VIT1/CCC1 family predicted Fe2+/Mn2+ transporter